MSAECAVGSRPCSEDFVTGSLFFHSPQKPNVEGAVSLCLVSWSGDLVKILFLAMLLTTQRYKCVPWNLMRGGQGVTLQLNSIPSLGNRGTGS